MSSHDDQALARVGQNLLRPIQQQAEAYLHRAKAGNTRRAYESDWRHFTSWCTEHEQISLPATPETVALYLSALAEVAKVSTLTRRLSSISQAHQMAGHSSPAQHIAVRTLMAGIRRTKSTAQTGKSPVRTEELRQMVATLPKSVTGIRDRALLLLGFAGAFRRSELVGLDRHDLQMTEDGLVAIIRRSKTDQEGAGRKVGIPYGSQLPTCPVRAMQGWLDVIGAAEGPLFRAINRHGQLSEARLSDKSVALIVKRAAEEAGLDPALYAGHSLRAGLATAAANAGVSERSIMAQTGHRSVATVRKYIREGSLFRDNAASKVGL